MFDLVPIDPKILAILRGSFGKDGMPMPFMREIFLLECNIAGTSFLDLEDVEKRLSMKDTLMFLREPDNQHDHLAIVIHDQKGNKLGYVPQAKNEVLARLMDAGKLIFGVLEHKKWHGDWLRLDIRIYMRDL